MLDKMVFLLAANLVEGEKPCGSGMARLNA